MSNQSTREQDMIQKYKNYNIRQILVDNTIFGKRNCKKKILEAINIKFEQIINKTTHNLGTNILKMYLYSQNSNDTTFT